MSIDLNKNFSSYFPHFTQTTPDGIIAYGGVMEDYMLLDAYSNGIFPWYNEEPILWWNPDPRFVLFPDSLKISKSMRPYFNQEKFSVSYNTCFTEVMARCKNIKRTGQEDTWLNDHMINAYTTLHHQGYALSAEVWDEEKSLVGGLYGLLIGKIFFGESMFSDKSNASKFGFISLVKMLQQKGVVLIDCQQETAHLRNLGADFITREEFMGFILTNRVEQNIQNP